MKVLFQLSTPCHSRTIFIVRVGKKGLTDCSKQVCDIKCRLQPFPTGGTMMIVPDEGCNLPEGLELFPTVVDVPAGALRIVYNAEFHKAQHFLTTKDSFKTC